MSETQQKNQSPFQRISEWLAIIWCVGFALIFLNLATAAILLAWLVLGLVVFVLGLINLFIKPRSPLLITITIITGIGVMMFLLFILVVGGLGSAL